MPSSRIDTILSVWFQFYPINLEGHIPFKAIAVVGVCLEIIDLQWQDAKPLHLPCQISGGDAVAMIAGTAAMHRR